MDYELNRQGVRRVSYDSVTSQLRIEFMRGAVYAYDAVPESIVTWLVRTKDVAGYVQRVITPRFAYRRLSSPPATRTSGEQDLEARLRASLAQVAKEPSAR